MSDDLVTWLRAQLDLDGDRFKAGRAADAEWRCLDVESKRRMLDDILPALTWGDEASAGEWNDYTDHAGDFLKLLALPYAAREGYRAEWAS